MPVSLLSTQKPSNRMASGKCFTHLDPRGHRRRTGHAPDELVAFIRRRLCLPADRDEEIAELVRHHGRPAVRQVATLWWDA
jgi:hypothetical protein